MPDVLHARHGHGALRQRDIRFGRLYSIPHHTAPRNIRDGQTTWGCPTSLPMAPFLGQHIVIVPFHIEIVFSSLVIVPDHFFLFFVSSRGILLSGLLYQSWAYGPKIGSACQTHHPSPTIPPLPLDDPEVATLVTSTNIGVQLDF